MVTTVLPSLLCFDVFGQNNDNKILSPSEIYSPVGVYVPKKSDKDLAFQYYNQQDYEKAIVYFDRLYKEQTTQYNYKYLLYSYIGAGQYDNALEFVQQERKKNKKKLSYIVDEGYIYCMTDNMKKGYKLYDEAIDKLDAKTSDVYDIANAFMGVRETKYAIKTYLKGQELLGDNKLFLENIAYCYYIEQQYDMMTRTYLDYALFFPKKLGFVQAQLQNFLSNDPEGIIADAVKHELLARTQQSGNETTFYYDFLLWYSIQIKDFDMAFRQLKAINKMGKDESGKRMLDFANTCFLNDNFDVAKNAYSFLIDTYTNSDEDVAQMAKVGLLNMDYANLQSTENIDNEYVNNLDKQFTDLLAGNENSASLLPSIINSAYLKAYYIHDYDGAITKIRNFLEKGKQNQQNIAKAKLVMGDIYIIAGDPWEAILCYSQVEKMMKDEPLGHEAKYRNAILSYYIGEFDWAETKLDVLKSSTEKLIANDAMQLSLFIKENRSDDSTYTALKAVAQADLATFERKYDLALSILDSVGTGDVWNPVNDDVLLKKAKIYLTTRRYALADTLLGEIINNYAEEILADEAMFTKAFINEKYLNNKDLAKSLYEKLILDYPDSIFTIESRNRYRELRGDANVRGIKPEDDIIYVPLLEN